MAKKKIRLGLIGCGGNMRGAHVPRIKAAGGVDIVAVADPSEESAKALIEAWGSEAAYYADWRKMLKAEQLDAVEISSPHSTHYDQARTAMKQGLHCLVEKPLVIEPRHATALLKLAQETDKLLVVSYQRHFLAAFAYVRELIQQGAIGELRGVVSYVTQAWGGRGWRGDPVTSGGGMFMDTGSHLVAATLWLTGLEVDEVTAFIDNGERQVDTNAVVSVKFKSGALGTLNTFGNAARHDERIAIHGSTGCIVFHQHQWKIISLRLNGEPIEIPSRVQDENPDAAFFRWIRNGGKGYELPEFALQVARVSAAAYQSAAERKPVKVKK